MDESSRDPKGLRGVKGDATWADRLSQKRAPGYVADIRENPPQLKPKESERLELRGVGDTGFPHNVHHAAHVAKEKIVRAQDRYRHFMGQ